MLIRITVAAADLEDVNKLLNPNILEKPDRELCFELRQSSLRIVPNPITTFITYDEWIMLSDYEERE